MRPARWAIVLLAATVFLALAGGGGARAESGAVVAEFGWWSQVPGASTQAGGGFQVADSPAGPLSVAAIRISVTAPSLSSAKLVLPENTQTGTASLQVCPTRSSWTAASPGAWDQRPTPDCASPIPLVRDAAALVWTADVLSVVSSAGEVSLMVVPGPPGSGLPAPAPFQISFRGAEIQSEAGTALPEPVASPAPSDSGFADTFGAASAVGSPSDFGVPAPLPGPAVAAAPASEQIVAAPAQTPGRFPQRGDVGAPGGGEKKPWGRLPLLTLTAAAVGAGTTVGRKQLVARGLLSA